MLTAGSLRRLDGLPHGPSRGEVVNVGEVTGERGERREKNFPLPEGEFVELENEPKPIRLRLLCCETSTCMRDTVL